MRKKEGEEYFGHSRCLSSFATFVGNIRFDKYLAGYTWDASQKTRRFLCEVSVNIT